MPMPDYRTPSPDEGHEAIRAPLAAAIDDLTEQIERVDDAYLLLLSATDFAQGTLRTVLAAQAAMNALKSTVEAVLIRERTAADCIDALETTVNDLAKRLAALEATPTEETP